MRRFLDTFLYREEVFLVDEVVALDPEARRVEARMDTTRPLPFAAAQRVGPGYPAHVSAAELLMLTGNLGCLHAWFFHGCLGNRIHRADFKSLARLGPPLVLESVETRTRVGARRVVIRYAFRFTQSGDVVYVSDQTAMFFKDSDLA
jgi:hypothetical protein